MISTRAKPIRRLFRPNPGGELRHDPAGLSASLRELAARAHRAVRSAQQAEGPSAHSQKELVELHAQIAELQRSLQSQSLEGLVPYVSALRREVRSLIVGR
jgi:hypothetical protein